jgi:sterol desaturase/sphingolipid hydroxylase (fatty acid hydroxylase superfamily)
MDRPPASSAPYKDDAQSFGDAAVSARDDGSIKQTLINLIPPAMLVAVVAFWMNAPASVIDNPWALVGASAFITFFILGLEWVFERHEGWRLNKREFATDLFYLLLVYTAIAWVTEALSEAPLRSIKASLGIATPWVTSLPFIVQALLVIVLIEGLQYWMHRLMHNWHPFWLTHAPHHHITQLNAMKGAVGNPIELFLISISPIALFDFATAPLFCALTMSTVITTFAHANVRANPPLFYSFFFTTIRHHSLHHSVPYEDTRCNFGNSLILFDRILGTYKEGEASVVGQDERKRLSIYQQFMFPFQPMIDKYKARRTTAAPG